MPQADYGLLNSGVKLNTPFENLNEVMRMRANQENARGLAEQRQALAGKARAETEQRLAATAQAAQFQALWNRTDPSTGQPVVPTLEESAAIIGPEDATKIFDGFEALKTKKLANQSAEAGRIATVLGGLQAWPEAERPKLYQTLREHWIEDGTIQPGDAPEAYSAGFVNSRLRQALSAKEQLALDAPKPDYTLGDSRMSGETNQPLATAAPKVTAPALGSASDFVAKWAADRKLDPAKLSAAQTAAAVQAHARASQAPSQAQPSQEPLVSIMGPDGQSVLVRRSQAEGKRPASTREQGRPVTANDASDLADFDTSLDELAAVRAAISPSDSTGIVARAAATIPYVTQITGWGADAKKRQAVIDRVKQVIGKTLEGGVLRKEDEAKYEKILPNIGDSPDVATSKLNGLDAAIAKRKGRRLDALADAGYDTGRFTARGGAPAATAKPPAGETPDARIKRLLGGG